MSVDERIRQAIDEAGERCGIVLPLYDGATVIPIDWLEERDAGAWDQFPELDDVEDELAARVPLAVAIVREDRLHPIVIAREAPHAVSYFQDGWHALAPDLGAFVASLLGDGDVAPAVKVRDAIAAGAFDAAVAPYGEAPGAYLHRDVKAYVGEAWSQIGVARSIAGDDAGAERAWDAAAAWGSIDATRARLSAAVGAKRWADARAQAEALLSTWKSPDDATALRATLARALVGLGDLEAAKALGAQQAKSLARFAHTDRPRAEGLQASFLAALDAIEGDAAVVAAIREPVAVPFAAPGTVAQADIDEVVRLVEQTKALVLRNRLTAQPAIARDPAVVAALAAMPDTSAARQVRSLIAELAAKE